MPIDLHLSAILFGILGGLVGGLMPGVGNLMSMLLVMPFMTVGSAMDALLCFAVLTQISQFVGSLTAVYTGIPGEASSMPTVHEVKKIRKSQYSEVIASSAVGSTVGAFFAIVLCYALSYYFSNVVYVFRTDVVFALLVISVYLVCRSTVNKLVLNIFLLAAGVLLGQVGWNNITNSGFLTFGYVDLYQGIPIEVVLLMLFALPQLYQLSKTSTPIDELDLKIKWPSLNYIKLTWYSFLGFLGGLMPGMTTVFSSQLAYGYASKKTSDPKERIVASETANNAGAVTQIIPLLVLGLPLVPSEAFTLSLMEIKGFIPSPSAAAEYYQLLLPALMLSAIIGLVIAWPMANFVLKILKANINLFRIGMIVLLTGNIIYQSYLDKNTSYVIICILGMLPLTWLVRKTDTMSLIFGFFISTKLIDYSLRFFNLHFL